MYGRLISILIASILCGCAHPGAAPLLFVSNEGDGTVSVVDLDDRAVIATIEAGTRPRGLGLSPDGTRLYVALGTEDAKPTAVLAPQA